MVRSDRTLWPSRRPDRLCDVELTIELEGDQLGDLGRDVRHRLFLQCSGRFAGPVSTSFTHSVYG